MFRHRLEQHLPLNGVEGVPEVQLQKDVVRQGLLQPHPDFVDQALRATQDPNTHLLRLQATGRLRLVAADQQLTRQPTKGLTDGDGPHPSTPFPQGDKAGPGQGRQT